MGIIIRAAEPYGHVPPIPVEIMLDCDDSSQMFCRGVESFKSPDGYIGAHAVAMKRGWLERQTRQGRKWVCPACSGK